MTDEKIVEYRKLIKLGKVLEFREDEQELCDSRTEYVYLRSRSCEKLS
jgi:hypothetical protein